MVLQRNMAKIVDMASVDLSIYFARVKRRFDTKGTRPLRCLGEENRDARSRNIDGDHGHSYKNVSMGKNISIGMVISQKRRHG